MALLVRGGTKCGICNRLIETSDCAVMFPPLTDNRLDPLFLFSDSSFHQACFRQHPLSCRVERVMHELRARTSPGHRYCVVCGLEIVDPDEYFCAGYLTDDESDPLHRFNFVQLHKSCIQRWTDEAYFADLIFSLRQSGKWSGPGLDWILATLHAAAENPRTYVEQDRVMKQSVDKLARLRDGQ